jgi:hypothetical protein
MSSSLHDSTEAVLAAAIHMYTQRLLNQSLITSLTTRLEVNLTTIQHPIVAIRTLLCNSARAGPKTIP